MGIKDSLIVRSHAFSLRFALVLLMSASLASFSLSFPDNPVPSLSLITPRGYFVQVGLLLPASYWPFGLGVWGPICKLRLLVGAFYLGSSRARGLERASGTRPPGPQGLQTTTCQSSTEHSVHILRLLSCSQPKDKVEQSIPT